MQSCVCQGCGKIFEKEANAMLSSYIMLGTRRFLKNSCPDCLKKSPEKIRDAHKNGMSQETMAHAQENAQAYA